MKIQFFLNCMMILGVGVFINLMAVYTMAANHIQIFTAMVGSVFMICAFVLYTRQYLKELKLGPVRFE